MLEMIGNLVLVYIFSMLMSIGITTIFDREKTFQKVLMIIGAAAILVPLYLWGLTIEMEYFQVWFFGIIIVSFVNQSGHLVKKRQESQRR
ncbi:hypothetical protein [Bacillus suaedaesalsae]|uniref:Holin n=1 Tax=Bacillus suaedaesalsae TaxID=2810349 RepID=A0ABS2DIW4_9BACI|nr:hypothetical protein [Bacillus suaedaesalsae]MBM6617940.1 hypothetical protein [Bacillus suaedaesalsae]